MKKVALIGINGFARHFYRQFLRLHQAGSLSFAAVVIRSPQKCPDEIEQLKALGCRIYASPEELFADHSIHYDLIALPTGIPSHEPLLEAGLRYGANIFVEKPLTGTVESARRMIAAANAHPQYWTAVGFQNVSGDEVREVKKRLLAGEIGSVRKIVVTGLWPRNNAYYERNNWAARLKCGDDYVLDSPINNAFAHFLNLALFFSASQWWDNAKIRGVQAELYRARPIETFDTCSVRFLTLDNVEVLLNLTHASEIEVDPMIRIEGSAGSVEWQLRNYCRIHTASGCREIQTGDAFPVQFDRIAARLNGASEELCTLNMAGKHTFCINAIHMNARPVSLPESAFDIAPDGQRRIHGIADIFKRCQQQGCLVGELGDVAWSVPAPFRECTAIEHFEPLR